MQILLPALPFPGFFLAPESPRWLASVDRKEDAAAVIAKHHANGDINSPLVQYEAEEIVNTIKTKQEAHASASYADMLKTKGNRWRLLISITLGLFSHAHLSMPASLEPHLGRRSGSNGREAWSTTFVPDVCTGNSAVGLAVIPLLFVFFAGYDIALTPLIIAYPIEIWQFQLRSRGFSVLWTSGIVAGIFNMFVNPIALGSIGWKYYFTYIVFLAAFVLLAYFCYPETKGRTLEQMAYIFDGEDADSNVLEGKSMEGKTKVLSIELERKSG
ncbi:hexose transporter [Fusarium mundagurra]|uniref:Hexose transporter n=1 Tax=Fusarium mundagurra TaxID=1567541 RepID=A0A8H5Y5G1_9HYPO|nr:hexose transporter [Fusarium mundagurra]